MPRRRKNAPPRKSFAWWVTWPVHTIPRYLGWWAKEFLAGLGSGLVQGARIGWHEVRAVKIQAKWEEKGISFYSTPIWGLLREITFDPHRTVTGGVRCEECKTETFGAHCHHIVHIAQDNRLAFTPSNLQALCPGCHDDKHPNIKIG